MTKEFKRNTAVAMVLVFFIIIAAILVYKAAGSKLQRTVLNDKQEIVSMDEHMKAVGAELHPDEEKVKMTAGKDEVEKLKTEIMRLKDKKQKLEDSLNILMVKVKNFSPYVSLKSGSRSDRGIISRTDSKDSVFSGPPLFNSQPLYMNTENTIQNRSRAVLKIVDADNYSEEIVSRINPYDKAVFQLGKKNIKHLAVIWKDRDSIIDKLNLLQKPEPTVSFIPSVSQGEGRVNANTANTVSLLRIKSVRPKEIGVKFNFEPDNGREFLNIRPEFRNDEAVYQFKFNFRSKGEFESFLDKYENKFYDPEKNNCFIKVSVSVYDKVTDKKFENLDQTFKVFFYRYE